MRRIDQLIKRIDALGIGQPHHFEKLFKSVTGWECSYWTDERLERLWWRQTGGKGCCVLLGCPFVPEDQWVRMGGWTGEEGYLVGRVKRPDCKQCEHGIQLIN